MISAVESIVIVTGAILLSVAFGPCIGIGVSLLVIYHK